MEELLAAALDVDDDSRPPPPGLLDQDDPERPCVVVVEAAEPQLVLLGQQLGQGGVVTTHDGSVPRAAAPVAGTRARS